MGLMTQVLNAFRRFSVLKLEKTYAALPVSQIAERTSPISSDLHETENYLASLISSGQLNAVLVPSSASGKGTILRFSPPTSGPPTRSETEQYEELQKEQRKIAELAEQVKATDWKLELSKEYIEWAKRAKRAKDGAGPGADQNTSMMGMGDEDFAADEDMMADM
ncbi:hypothetical protein MMC20_000990 [Loxospora ochrophaea]|nr:hypothetical protein [Loxospora ochrophaea]